MTSVSSLPSLIVSAPTTIVCIRVLHLMHSDAPLWKLMPKGERNEVGDGNQGELWKFTFEHLHCISILSMSYIAKLLNYVVLNYD
jgi:hypothetical protein